MAARPVQQTPHLCLCSARSLEGGAWSAPPRRDGAGGGCVCLAQGSSRPVDLPELPTPAPPDQAVLGSLVPHCASRFAGHFGISFQIHLREKIAVCVGRVDLSVGYAEASSLGKAQGEAGDGLYRHVTAVQQATAGPASGTLCKLFEHGTKTLLHPSFLRLPITSPALGGHI